MKSRITLFGAGNNCRGVIKFLGKENINMILDNDMMKWGRQIEDISIVSLSEFINCGMDDPILITVITGQNEIMSQLKEAGIKRIYYAPSIQFGFYKNTEDLINFLEMDKSVPVFFGNNPITDKITETLAKKGITYKILDCKEDDYFVLNRQEESANLITEQELSPEKRVFITDAKEHDLENVNYKVINIADEYKEKHLPEHRELARFKDIHKGKRCFLIGNGPSLLYSDLEKLRKNKEITFGVNRIYQSFDKTEWRPDYYIIVDSIVMEQDLQKIKNYDFPVVFIGNNYSEIREISCDNYFCFSRKANRYLEGCFSEDITNYIYGGSTVIFDAMQIAAYMGFSEIILLGVDMTDTKIGEKIPHFYDSDTESEKDLAKGNILNAMKAFSITRHAAQKRGIQILNATRGGNVEVLERVDFDRLFDENREENPNI